MDFIVLSHLRWDFVFQRPQHLMTRCAERNRVFFWEEPIFDATGTAYVDVLPKSKQLLVATPHLPSGLNNNQVWKVQESLLNQFVEQELIRDYVLWYYTPMARHFSRNLQAKAVVYDCMDELSGFRGAPPGLRSAEAELFNHADLVFTGGKSLYESKKLQHHSVHCFPSSIDREFFQTARHIAVDPADQAQIPHPRLGYSGVIDERMDTDLIAQIADRRPDWQIVMLGPVVKISESDLPRTANIHYLGGKDYHLLPSYLAGWDLGLLPFALNESTRFVSPTKTPEYLAAGLPVVTTPIKDVLEPYGTFKLVEVAANIDQFIEGAQRALACRDSQERIERVDRFLSRTSWDLTWSEMRGLIEATVRSNRSLSSNESAGRGSSVAAD
jgi:UDP-galactopyranose mutase